MQTTSKRGRPQEADPRHISSVALQLFERKGFDRVTMGEIAEAASVSRRTLFRFFPSKSDLVWGRLSDVRDILKQRAATLATGNQPLGVVFGELVEPFLRPLDEPEAAEMAKRRLRLIAEVPALFNHPTLREIEALIALTVAGTAVSHDTSPELVARALFATTFAALLWWADHGEGQSALEAMRAAFRAVALAQLPDAIR